MGHSYTHGYMINIHVRREVQTHTSMSRTFIVPELLKPILSQSGFSSGAKPPEVGFPCSRLILFGAALKCGVSFVRYPYCLGEGKVGPISGIIDGGRSASVSQLDIRKRQMVRHTRVVSESFHHDITL
jgi:hypothetical protein